MMCWLFTYRISPPAYIIDVLVVLLVESARPAYITDVLVVLLVESARSAYFTGVLVGQLSPRLFVYC